jgi:tetratricopeptide (TPR) repeat protein
MTGDQDDLRETRLGADYHLEQLEKAAATAKQSANNGINSAKVNSQDARPFVAKAPTTRRGDEKPRKVFAIDYPNIRPGWPRNTLSSISLDFSQGIWIFFALYAVFLMATRYQDYGWQIIAIPFSALALSLFTLPYSRPDKHSRNKPHKYLGNRLFGGGQARKDGVRPFNILSYMFIASLLPLFFSVFRQENFFHSFSLHFLLFMPASMLFYAIISSHNLSRKLVNIFLVLPLLFLLSLLLYSVTLEGGSWGANIQGRSYLQQDGNDNTQKAIEYFTKAISLEGTDPVLFGNRSSAYQKLGDIKKARADLLSAIKLGKSSEKHYYLAKLIRFDSKNQSLEAVCSDLSILALPGKTIATLASKNLLDSDNLTKLKSCLN